jgi:hypothetical protein
LHELSPTIGNAHDIRNDRTSGPATISRRTALASAGAGVLFSALPFGTRRMAEAQTGGPAELIFRGGSIVTVEEAMPTAEAVAVAGGRILAVGTEAEVMALATDATRIVDLAGAALLPGFIDSHGHFMNALSIVNWVNVSGPPVGPVSSIADAVAAVRAFADERKPAPGNGSSATAMTARSCRTAAR